MSINTKEEGFKKTKIIFTFFIVTISSLIFVFLIPFFFNAKLQKEISTLTILSFLDDGTTIDFNKVLEKKEGFVVHFFGTWCPHCIADHDVLLQNNNYKNIYGIAYRDSKNTLKPWLQIKGNPYDNIGIDPKGIVTKYLGINSVPTTLIFNSNGKIVKLYRGSLKENRYIKDLQKYLTIK